MSEKGCSVEFIDVIYHRLREELRETLEDCQDEHGEFSPLDVGMALGLLAVELGWTFGQAADSSKSVADRVRPTLRVIRSIGEDEI